MVEMMEKDHAKYFIKAQAVSKDIIELSNKEKDFRVLYLGTLIAERVIKQGLIGSGMPESAIRELEDYIDVSIIEILNKTPELRNLKDFTEFLKKKGNQNV